MGPLGPWVDWDQGPMEVGGISDFSSARPESIQIPLQMHTNATFPHAGGGEQGEAVAAFPSHLELRFQVTWKRNSKAFGNADGSIAAPTKEKS